MFGEMLKESSNLNRPFVTSYVDYLKQHITCVKRAYEWIRDYCPDLFKYLFSTKDGLKTVDEQSLSINIENHDHSKWEIDEFTPYALYFYVDKEKYKDVFDLAWNHHQKRNKHHWQYWVLVFDEKEEVADGGIHMRKHKAIEMPLEYVFEMVCDWFAFSFKKGNLYELFNWYEEHRSEMLLHRSTEKVVEIILEAIKNVLDKNPAYYQNYVTQTFSKNDIECWGYIELDDELIKKYDESQARKLPEVVSTESSEKKDGE